MLSTASAVPWKKQQVEGLELFVTTIYFAACNDVSFIRLTSSVSTSPLCTSLRLCALNLYVSEVRIYALGDA